MCFSACTNEQGYKFNAPDTYTVHKGGCAVCTCEVIDGVAQAVCHHAYCPRLKCPASIQETVQGSCCKRCPPGYGKLRCTRFTRNLCQCWHPIKFSNSNRFASAAPSVVSTPKIIPKIQVTPFVPILRYAFLTC